MNASDSVDRSFVVVDLRTGQIHKAVDMPGRMIPTPRRINPPQLPSFLNRK